MIKICKYMGGGDAIIEVDNEKKFMDLKEKI